MDDIHSILARVERGPPMEPDDAKKVAGAEASLTRVMCPGYPRMAATRMCGSDTGKTRNLWSRCGNAGEDASLNVGQLDT